MDKNIMDMDPVALARENKEYLSIYDLPVDADLTLTVTDVVSAQVENPKTRKKENKRVLCFKETDKKLVPNKVNMLTIRNDWHYTPIRELIGKQLTFYYDPEVMFGRDKVGGIRIRRPGEKRPPKEPEYICERCGQVIKEGKRLAQQTRADFGQALCLDCARKAKAERDGNL